MSISQTAILHNEWDVRRRLLELRTDPEKLLRIRDIAIGAAADATAFHPANAAGTFSYQHGTFALRNEHVRQDGWDADRPNGVEAIKNEEIRVRFVFANVDVACDDNLLPKARSDKGAGAERLCQDNGLFDHLPHYANDSAGKDGWTTFYLMVDQDGAVELSRASVKNGKFTDFFERVYVSDGSDFDLEPKLLEKTQDLDSFDPQVLRKNNGS